MTEHTENTLHTLRTSLTELKREAAKLIVRMNFGGDDVTRVEMDARMAVCRARARELAVTTDAYIARLDHTWSQDAHEELAKAAKFLAQMQRMGLSKEETEEA